VEIGEVLQQAVSLMFQTAEGDGSMSAATGAILEDGSLRVATLTLVIASMKPVAE
jgi:hypothetical protein